jgi:hypothetical protein
MRTYVGHVELAALELAALELAALELAAHFLAGMVHRKTIHGPPNQRLCRQEYRPSVHSLSGL